MKFQSFALSLLALMPACATAQTPTVSKAKAAAKVPNATMDPAARALLERAVASYKGASGISYRLASFRKGESAGVSSIQYSRPNLLSISSEDTKDSGRVLMDGSNIYIVQGTSYRKMAASPGFGLEASSPGSGQILAAMIDGKNPIEAMHSSYASLPDSKFQGKTVALAPRVIDGDVLSGVQSTFSVSASGRGGAAGLNIKEQVTAWFGGSPLLLRRVQVMLSFNGQDVTIGERILEQQLSPTFADDAFKFNDTGLKLAADEGGGDQQYWDPRLKVGTAPFKFQTKALNSAPISLDKYKGKVLVMDFWATWCGPCVASLPELKGAYDKYHAQGVEVIGISLDQDKKALTSFIKTNKMAWPQIFDGDNKKTSVANAYGVKAIPFLLIIGKDGKIASVNPRGKIDEAVKAALSAG